MDKHNLMPQVAQPVLPNLPTGNKIKLKSWKGDYLHRPDSPQGVTTWSTGVGNEWTVEALADNKIKLKSWKGDYLHRPDSPPDVTTWNTGVGNEWELEVISLQEPLITEAGTAGEASASPNAELAELSEEALSQLGESASPPSVSPAPFHLEEQEELRVRGHDAR